MAGTLDRIGCWQDLYARARIFAATVRKFSFAMLMCWMLEAPRAFELAAADVRQLSISRIEDFVQRDEGAPVYAGPGSFSFYAFVDGASSNSVESATVKLPDGKTEALKQNVPPTWDFLDFHDNPVLLDLAYPTGRYAITITTRTGATREIPIALTESFFPNAPRIVNWPAAQQILADKPFEIQWEPFAEGTRQDFIYFAIYDWEEKLVFATADQPGAPGALDGTATSITLPPQTLRFGQGFRAILLFARIASNDSTTYPGVPALASFIRRTEFPLETAGTPDFTGLDFNLSFTYIASGGDFMGDTFLPPSYPARLNDCYVARLLVLNEEFVPQVNTVTFSSPPGTAITNVESEFRYEQDGGWYYETPCLSEPTNTLPGIWTVRYKNYPIQFEVVDAEPIQRLAMPVPTVTLDGPDLKDIQWTWRDANGDRLPGTPAFIDRLVIELYDRANFTTYTSSNLILTAASLAFTNSIPWQEVGSFAFAYQDNYRNWYRIDFYHSPPGSLTIVNRLFPLGSLASDYRVQLIASNGVPPYTWSIDNGNLPRGLTLEPETGVIRGVPEAVGTFRFAVRVDDAAGAFEQDQFFITITTNGPPIIIEPPRGGDVDVGDYTYFEVNAEGTQPLTYQWFFNDQSLPGETNAILELINISTNRAGLYKVSVQNVAGSITSEPAKLVVLSPPVILRQPASQTAKAGSTVTFAVQAASAPPLFYQWRHNGEYLDAATNALLTIENAQPRDAGTYDVIVAGPEGVTISDDATLQFIIDSIPLTNRFANRQRLVAASGLGRGNNGGGNREPGEPTPAGILGGSSTWITWIAPTNGIARFTTEGSAIDTVLGVYLGQDVTQLQEITSDDDTGGFFASLVRFNAEAGQAYEIMIDGVYGSQGEIMLNWSMDTSGARIPVIVRQPVDAIVAQGATATFSLLATNPPPATGPLSYQWFFNGNPIQNGTNDILIIPNATDANLGLYEALVSNNLESVFSAPVVVQFNTSDGDVDQLVSTEDKFVNVPRDTNVVGQLQMLAFNSKRIVKFGGSVARGFTGSQIFSTVGSSSEAGEPTHCDVVGGASQWFSYLAEANGTLEIDTEGSDFDTILAVYSGTGLTFASLVEVACDNDSGTDGEDSRVSFPALAGTLYFIVVDGVGGETGTAHLNFRLDAPSKMETVFVNQELHLRVTGPGGIPVTIESSLDLKTWIPFFTTNSASGVIDRILPRPPAAPIEFYRSSRAN